MTYVNAFVASVPTGNKDSYLAQITPMDEYFKSKGALRVVECWGADVPDGKLTSFPMAVKAEEGETVVFGWIEWNSKAESDAAMGAMMSDPKFADMPMPFDGKKMIFGGFETILEL